MLILRIIITIGRNTRINVQHSVYRNNKLNLLSQ